MAEAAPGQCVEQYEACHLPQAWLPGQKVCQRCVVVRKAAADIPLRGTSQPSLSSRSRFAEDARLETCNRAIL